jgi:hypothetical protein
MSAEDETTGPAARLADTVTPAYFGRPDSEMHAIGLLIAGLMLVLLIPLLPFVAVLWAVNRLANARQGTDLDPNFNREETRPS